MYYRHEEEELRQAVAHDQKNCDKVRQHPCPFDLQLVDKRDWETQEPTAVDSRTEMGAKPKHEASFKLEMDLVDLLKKLDLSHLSPLFVVNQVTMRDLKRLESKDLQDIGIQRLMDRKLILEAAKEKQPVEPQIKRDTSTVKSVQKVLM